MTNKKTLIAGPWVGEFGWELFAWQAYIRALSKYFSKTIVFSRTSSKELYSDFCDEFYEFNPSVGLSDSFFMHNLDINKTFKKIIKDNKISLENCAVVFPKRIGFPPHTHFNEFITFGSLQIQPEYITFGEEGERKYDYIFHIRDRDLRKEDNWSKANWKKLASLLRQSDDVNIACIGTTHASGWVEKTEDLRGIELGKLLNIMRNCKCVLGPSSGPLHLASLCNSPHMVWGSRKMSQYRYERNWNPLQTPVLFLDKYSWHPSAEYVYEKFKEWKIK